MHFKKNFLLSMIVTISWSIQASDLLNQSNIEHQLARFNNNPKQFMNELPLKQNDYALPSKAPSFELRLQVRDKIIEQSSSLKSAPGANDQVENLVEVDNIIRRLDTMEEKKIMTGKVQTAPWSDDYWPIAKGILGARYADEEFLYFTDWSEAFDYIQDQPVISIFNEEDNESIDLLSPAEKYDLLLGTDSSPLTNSMWASGKKYYDRDGTIESWMGICHGWAPASYMLERPKRSVQVMSADGKTNITFYPADIKALASLLWANSNTPTNFIGGRCNNKKPEQDENGRILSNECFDSNPATWHMAITNHVGIDKKSFVLDVTYDYQVWNQPIVSYKYTYFNPVTLKQVETLKQATISIAEYENDKFKKYRSPDAKNIVGISMEVTYGIETSPKQSSTDSVKNDAHNTALYLYDLELNEDGSIIGGEWYQNAHPDFLWTPESGTRALSSGDYYIYNDNLWNGTGALPQDWVKYGIHAAKRGQPLAMVVESLIKLSNQ